MQEKCLISSLLALVFQGQFVPAGILPWVSDEKPGTAGKGGHLGSGGASLMHTSCFALGKVKERQDLRKGWFILCFGIVGLC